MSFSAPSPTSKLLVVDDEEANVRLLERLLLASGYERVTGTTSSADAVEIIERDDPDLVLLDLHMPGLTGFDILKRMRSQPATKHTPVVVLTADESKDARERALDLGARDYLTKPFDRTEVALRVRNLLEMRALHRQLEEHNLELETRVRERTTELWGALQAVEKSEQEVRRSQAETVTRLSIAAEYRDDDTALHIHRMSRYCEMLAAESGVDAGTVELIRVASVMHDVGKIGIPDSILRKPGKLTDAQRTMMEEHARIGYQILSGSESDLLQLAAEIALSHHERWDGTGYPQKRSGEDIPLSARIAAIADVFDAISTDRVYRKAMAFPKAMEVMRGGRGTHFDPALLDVFFENIDKVLKIKEELEAAA